MDSDLLSQEVGDLLFQQGKLTDKQLDQVRRRQRRLNIPQHKAVIDLNYASEEDTHRALARLHQLDFVDLSQVTLDQTLLQQVPVKVIFHYHLLPLALEGNVLTVALSEPPKAIDLGNLRLVLGKQIKVVLTTPSAVHSLIKGQFGLGAETIQKLREDRGVADLGQEIVFDVPVTSDSAMDATISAFVDQILAEALRLQATDIHIEPFTTSIRLRYRVDGLMQNIPVPLGLRQVYAAIVSRLKIMAGLNIAEKRLPQDGRIAMTTHGDEYDLRVSVIPMKHGEAVCLRILGHQSLFLDMGQLGMEPQQEALFADLTRLPQGLVLITGPTGSGKTTTLYAALAHANDESRKIITLEDPIEYQLEGASQIQVRDDIGLTFSSGLRSILRHDPDIVLVGEIRDAETAEIAVRAAQTGHLVFSTLHTNDSVGAIIRLVDMEIEPFLVASSLVCSVAQRLVRRVCRHCAETDPDIPESVRAEMAAALRIDPAMVRAARGHGCIECNQRGSRGRVAIYEFFLVNDEIADLIGPGVKTGELRNAARKYGWRSLRDQAWTKVQAGLVPVSELERMTRELGLRAQKP